MPMTEPIHEPERPKPPSEKMVVSVPAEQPQSADAGSKSGLMTKVIGAIGAIVTSILVGLGVKYADQIIGPSKPPAPSQIAVVIHSPPPDTSRAPPTTTASRPRNTGSTEPPDPTKLYVAGPPETLFNGTDLTGFSSLLGDPKELQDVTPMKPLGKNNDPLMVFSVQDGLLRVSGQVYGTLLTHKQYENYLLSVDYRWGEQTWPPRTDSSRTSGILLHCVSPDDAVRKMFPQSIRCRIQEGRTGDFRFMNAPRGWVHSLTVEYEQRGAGINYSPGGPAKAFADGWIQHLGTDPSWRDEKGWHSPGDAEKPAGQWNTLECYCCGDTITIRLNGKVVNHATHSAQTKGKIGLQSYKAEIFFRNLELRPLTKK
jgi:hypothetical protein